MLILFALLRASTFLPQRPWLPLMMCDAGLAVRQHVRSISPGWALGAIAVALYLPGIGWGLPHATHPLGVHSWDGDAVTGIQTLAELHNLFLSSKPDWWLAYPLLHHLVIGLVYAPYLGLLLLTGGLSHPTTEFPYGLADPVSTLAMLTLIGRSVTVLMASGIVVATYRIGLTIWDRPTGILAGVSVLLLTPMWHYARTGNLDVPVQFWMSLSVLTMASCMAQGYTTTRGVLVGTCAGLSVATKDQAYGALLVGIAALLLIHYLGGRATATVRTSFWRRWNILIATVLSSAVVYLLAAGFVLSPARFFGHLHFLVDFRHTFWNVVNLDVLRPNTPEGYGLLMLDVVSMLVLAAGPVLVLAGLGGLATTWNSTPFTRVLVLMVFGHLFLVIWVIQHMYYRYIIFVAFVVALLAARFIVMAARRGRTNKILAMAVLGAGLAWLGARGLDVTYQMVFDARVEAGKWLAAHCQQGDQVAFFGLPNTIPDLPRGMSARGWLNDPTAADVLREGGIRFVLLSPDFSSDAGMDRSTFVPLAVYAGLKNGSLGYERVAFFWTPSLFHDSFLDLPVMSPGYIVDPTVQVFESKSVGAAGGRCS